MRNGYTHTKDMTYLCIREVGSEMGILVHQSVKVQEKIIRPTLQLLYNASDLKGEVSKRGKNLEMAMTNRYGMYMVHEKLDSSTALLTRYQPFFLPLLHKLVIKLDQ